MSPSPRPYFVSAVFDASLAGGLSIASFVVLYFLGDRVSPTQALLFSVYLMWVVNWPHFSATLYRLFRSRENTAQFPVTAAAVPVVIALGIAAAFISPARVAPALVNLFLLWSPYHFSGQTVGITLLYARRSGVRLDGWFRRAVPAFVFGTYLVSTLRSETGPNGAEYYGINYPGLGLPGWAPRVAEWGTYAAGAALLVGIGLWMRRERRLFPAIVLVPMAAQYVWFVLGATTSAFYVFVPFFHSLQYLPIAWAMELGEPAPASPFVVSRTLRWGAINLAGGAALFLGLPWLLSRGGMNFNFATGVVIAGVQIHHFFVDGVIWKLRSSRVASPLMACLVDYLGTTDAPRVKRAA